MHHLHQTLNEQNGHRLILHITPAEMLLYVIFVCEGRMSPKWRILCRTLNRTHSIAHLLVLVYKVEERHP